MVSFLVCIVWFGSTIWREAKAGRGRVTRFCVRVNSELFKDNLIEKHSHPNPRRFNRFISKKYMYYMIEFAGAYLLFVNKERIIF